MGSRWYVGLSAKWPVLRMGVSRNVGLSAKWLVLRMGHFRIRVCPQNGGFYGWEPFRMDLMVTKGDES